MAMVWQRYHMISSAYTDVQRILEPHWTKRTPGHTQTKNGSLTFYFPLMNISTQENLRYHLIPSRDTDDQKILQSDGWETQLATPNYTRLSPMLPSFDGYLHATVLWYQLIPSKVIDDQRLLQSDWTGGITSHTPPKKVVWNPTFPRWLPPNYFPIWNLITD